MLPFLVQLSGALIVVMEIFGVNSKDQLAYLERVYQLQNARALMKGGVTLADPWRFAQRAC